MHFHISAIYFFSAYSPYGSQWIICFFVLILVILVYSCYVFSFAPVFRSKLSVPLVTFSFPSFPAHSHRTCLFGPFFPPSFPSKFHISAMIFFHLFAAKFLESAVYYFSLFYSRQNSVFSAIYPSALLFKSRFQFFGDWFFSLAFALKFLLRRFTFFPAFFPSKILMSAIYVSFFQPLNFFLQFFVENTKFRNFGEKECLKERILTGSIL